LSTPRPLLSLLTAPLTTEISTLSLHDALPIFQATEFADALQTIAQGVAVNAQRLGTGLNLPVMGAPCLQRRAQHTLAVLRQHLRSEEHTSELQSRENLVCRLLPEKKKTTH